MDVDYDNFKKGKNVHKFHDYVILKTLTMLIVLVNHVKSLFCIKV